jgi:phage protein D
MAVSRKNWVAINYPAAKSISLGTGIFPETLLAQAIVESQGPVGGEYSPGQSSLAKSANNYFGIKTDPSWTGPTVSLPTPNDAQKISKFRKYNSFEESAANYIKFLRENGRYQNAGVFSAKNYRDQIFAIANAGYAESGSYARTVISVADSIAQKQNTANENEKPVEKKEPAGNKITPSEKNDPYKNRREITSSDMPMGSFKVLYGTAEITQYVSTLTYTDKVHGESDEVTVIVDDVDQLWQSKWYPTFGDVISVYIEELYLGVFEIDEITFSGPGDTITIKAIAAGIKNAARTINSRAFENQKLSDIVGNICFANGFELEGEFKQNPVFDRVTQYRQTDLAFLKKIAENYGYYASLRGGKMIFLSTWGIHSEPPIMSIKKSDISSWSITDKTYGTYGKAQAIYDDPNKNTAQFYPDNLLFAVGKNPFWSVKRESFEGQLLQSLYPEFNEEKIQKFKQVLKDDNVTKSGAFYTLAANLGTDIGRKNMIDYLNDNSKFVVESSYTEKGFEDPYATDKKLYPESSKVPTIPEFFRKYYSKDTKKVFERVESQEQGEQVASSNLYNANADGCSGTITMAGCYSLTAGQNIILSDFGNFDGQYNIDSSTHNLSKGGGYTTSISIKKVLTTPETVVEY